MFLLYLWPPVVSIHSTVLKNKLLEPVKGDPSQQTSRLPLPVKNLPSGRVEIQLLKSALAS